MRLSKRVTDTAIFCQAVDKIEKCKEPKDKFGVLRDYTTQIYKRENDFCVTFETEDKLVIVFQGSNDSQDWKDDFEFKKNNYKVHSGFYYCAKRYSDLVSNIIGAIKRGKKVHIMGHSKGGSLALMLGFLLIQTYINEPRTYNNYHVHPLKITAIAPAKIGGEDIMDLFRRYNIDVQTIGVKRDVVLQLPFKVLGFCHMSKVQWLKAPLWHKIPIGGIAFLIHISYYRYILNRKRCYYID